MQGAVKLKMAIIKERSFPRGGQKPSKVGKSKRIELFDTRGKKKKEKVKQKKLKNLKEDPKEIITAEPLTYSTLTDGMLLLGCVINISDYYLRLSLPGRLVGKVSMTNVSSAYTKILKSLLDKKTIDENYYELKNMFKVGQFVVAKVMKITTCPKTNRHKVDLTLDPSSVNANYCLSSVKTGLVLHGAVKSIEDHGYMIDFGIRSLRAFLKTKKAQKFVDQWNDGRPLGVGQLVPCLIQKVDNISVASVVQVSADPSLTSSSFAELQQELSIHTLYPGTLVKSLVVESVRNGFLIEFLNFKGFVYRDHVGDPPPTLAALKTARVLYTIPLLNTVYLSILLGSKDLLAAPKDDETGVPKDGEVIKNARVLSASKRGVFISLGKYKNCKGFVTRKRLKDGKEILPERVKGLYPVDKEFCVRIIGRDILESIFICSAQKSIVEEELHSFADLKVGMKVTGTVLALKEKGLEVKLGKNCQGFVPLSHLADFPLQFPEKRFTKGKKVNGRVLRIIEEKGNILLTLKASLVDSDLPVVSSYDQAANVAIADGTIVKIFDKGLIVAFYNDVKGFVSLSQAGSSSSNPSNLRESFYDGQTVKCRIINCQPDQKKLLLSLLLNQDDEWKDCPLEIVSRIGRSYTLKVKEVTEDSLVVNVIGTNDKNKAALKGKKGVLPVLHLSDNASLTKCLLKTYKPGQKISAILHSVRATDDMQPLLVFSLRPSVLEFCLSLHDQKNSNDDEEDDEETSDDEDSETSNEDAIRYKVKEGHVLPCSVLEVCNYGLLLEAPIPKYGRKMLAYREYLADEIPEKVEDLGFVKNQLVFGKVMKKDIKKKKLVLSTMLSKFWDGYELEPSLELVKSYLTDLDHIQKQWKLLNFPLGKFVEGQKVEGTVISLSDSGAVIEVNKIEEKEKEIFQKVMAVVIPHHYKKKPIKVGDAIVGRVIFVDYPEGQLHLTLNPKTVEEMEGIAGAVFAVGKGVRVEILLCNKDVTIGFVKGNLYHGELVFFSTRCHHNDFFSSPDSETALKPGEIHKVIISAKVNGRMIGILKKYVNMLSKQHKNKEKRKRKHESLKDEQAACRDADDEPSPKHKKRIKLDRDEPDERKKAVEEQVHGKIKTNSKNEEMDGKKSLKKTELREAIEGQVNGKVKRTDHTKEIISDGRTVKPIDDDGDSVAKKRQIVDDAKKSASLTKDQRDKLPRLEATEGFVWDVDISSLAHVLPKNKKEVESSSDEEEEKDETDPKGKKGKKKKDATALREEEEACLREAEERLMDPDTCPQTADDFDRLVLSSPDSSIIWLKYVAFHLQNTEIEKARAVAQRALKTINFREEQEKLNIWVCLLNLENLYGTKESLEKVLHDAMQMNDTYKVYCQMMQIYLDSKKIEELDNLMNVMLKKFRDQKEAWVQAGTMCMKSNRPDKAGEMLRRSFKSLPERDHVDVICRWAQLEARSECGSLDRAQALLEGVLASCPKRTDIWSSLTDTLVKAGRIEDARNILERAVSQKLTVRKMKMLFKKYLSFEEVHGTPDKVARVRQLALDYVEKVMAEFS